MSTRIWATPAQALAVAKYCISKNLKESKPFLEQSKYIVRLNGSEVNVDYKVVDAMMYVLSTVEAKPKPKRTAKAKATLPTIE